MPPLRSAFSPVVIQESRYSGAYSHGKWVLTAGVAEPSIVTDAFGSDTDAMAFWTRVREDGPVIDVPDGFRGRERPVYVAAGDDPNELVKQFLADVPEDDD